jgi:hypothetical protein
MNKLAIFAFIASTSLALTAAGSEVAEVAKKEKARRQAVETQRNPARVFTNQDIINLKSSLAFEASQTEAVAPAESTGATTIATTPAPEPEATNLPPVPRQEPSAEQREREEQAQRLKEEREALEQQARDAQQTINQGGGYHTRNIGNQFKAKREAESRIREIDQELKKNEAGEEEEN